MVAGEQAGGGLGEVLRAGVPCPTRLQKKDFSAIILIDKSMNGQLKERSC